MISKNQNDADGILQVLQELHQCVFFQGYVHVSMHARWNTPLIDRLPHTHIFNKCF